MENLTATPVVLSDNAIIELKRLMDEDGFNHEQVLRVGVKGGGCSELAIRHVRPIAGQSRLTGEQARGRD